MLIMLIADVSTVVATAFATAFATLATLGLALALYQRAQRTRRARVFANPANPADLDGPRTLMPGMKA
jgi:hypothetical protein